MQDVYAYVKHAEQIEVKWFIETDGNKVVVMWWEAVTECEVVLSENYNYSSVAQSGILVQTTEAGQRLT